MRLYRGTRTADGALEVFVKNGSGAEEPLDLRLDLRNHSPTGPEVGYNGSGCAQLALAILADCLGDEIAVAKYQAYKRRVIATLPRDTAWKLSETEVRSVVERM